MEIIFSILWLDRLDLALGLPVCSAKTRPMIAHMRNDGVLHRIRCLPDFAGSDLRTLSQEALHLKW